MRAACALIFPAWRPGEDAAGWSATGVGAGGGETAGSEVAGEVGDAAGMGAWGGVGSIAKSARAAVVQDRAESKKIGSNFMIGTSV